MKVSASSTLGLVDTRRREAAEPQSQESKMTKNKILITVISGITFLLILGGKSFRQDISAGGRRDEHAHPIPPPSNKANILHSNKKNVICVKVLGGVEDLRLIAQSELAHQHAL